MGRIALPISPRLLQAANMVVLEGPEARKCEVRKKQCKKPIFSNYFTVCVCVWRQKPCVDTKYETVGQGREYNRKCKRWYIHTQEQQLLRLNKEDTSPTEIVVAKQEWSVWPLIMGSGFTSREATQGHGKPLCPSNSCFFAITSSLHHA